MIVPINDNWRIESTALSINLQERVVTPEINKRTGKPNRNPGEKWVDKTFHLSFAQALSSYALRQIRGLDALSRLPKAEKRILDEIKRVEAQLTKEAA